MRYSDFGDFFETIMKCHFPDCSQTEIAEALNTSQSNISKILKGAALPSEELLNTIKEKTGVDMSDTAIRAGKKYKALKKTLSEGAEIDTTEKKPRLPVTAAAGTLGDYLGGVLAHECEQMPVMRGIPKYDFTMIVKGNSMEPKYEGGDEIACKKVENIIEWGKVYVLATRDGAVIKRLYPAKNGFRCVSYNEEYPDFIVEEGDVLGKYRVVGLIRV